MSASEHGIVGGPCEESTEATTWMGYTRMDRNKIKWHVVGITAVTVGQLVYMLFVPMLPKRLLERCGSYRCVEWLWLAAPELLERWEHYCCRVWLVFRWVLFAAGAILWVIFVTSTEFMIAANQVEDGEREWSFGQMLSVSMLLAPAFDCIRVVIGDWWTRERQVAQRDRSVLEDGIELQTIRIDAA